MADHALIQNTIGPVGWGEFVVLGDDDRRELVDGRLEETQVPGKTHERIVALLIVLLGHWSLTRKAGQVLASGYKIRVNEHRGVMPDVQFYRAGNEPSGQEEGLETGRPDLVIEVISPTSRSKDTVRKLRDYATIEIPEYWIVDPEANLLQRLALRDGVYSIVDAQEGNSVFRPDSFEGLEIDLSLLWAESAS